MTTHERLIKNVNEINETRISIDKIKRLKSKHQGDKELLEILDEQNFTLHKKLQKVCNQHKDLIGHIALQTDELVQIWEELKEKKEAN